MATFELDEITLHDEQQSLAHYIKAYPHHAPLVHLQAFEWRALRRAVRSQIPTTLPKKMPTMWLIDLYRRCCDWYAITNPMLDFVHDMAQRACCSVDSHILTNVRLQPFTEYDQVVTDLSNAVTRGESLICSTMPYRDDEPWPLLTKITEIRPDDGRDISTHVFRWLAQYSPESRMYSSLPDDHPNAVHLFPRSPQVGTGVQIAVVSKGATPAEAFHLCTLQSAVKDWKWGDSNPEAFLCELRAAEQQTLCFLTFVSTKSQK